MEQIANTNSLSLSVAIITRNRVKLLINVLNCLKKQTIRPFEVLIIDNQSTDLTKQAIENFKKLLPIKYYLVENLGTSAARNIGIKKATGEILAFVDDDCEPEKNWLEEILIAHKTYPQATAIQGKIITLPKTGVFSRVFKEEYLRLVKSSLQSDNKCYFLDTANVSFKVNALKKHKVFFDENFRYYADDIDLAFQLLSKNLVIMYSPKIKAGSWIRTNPKDFFRSVYLKGVAQARLFYKWSYFHNYHLMSIGKQRIWLKDKKLVDFRYLPVKKKCLLCRDSNSNFLSQVLFHIIHYFSENFYKLGQKNSNQAINNQVIILQDGLQKKVFNKSKKLVVMIITRNRQESLKKLLFSLTRQTIQPHQIIIVDNASEDNTKELIQSFFKVLPIKYIYEQKVGIPYARNRALKETKEEIGVFVDDDCEVSPNWIEEILKAHKFNPRAAAIQGRSISMPQDSFFAQMFEANYAFWIYFNSYEKKYLQVCDTKNLFFNLKLLRNSKIKFDLNFKRGSDIDIANQLIHKGLKIVYADSILVHHWERKNILAFFVQLSQSGIVQAKINFRWPQYQKLLQKEDREKYNSITRNLGKELIFYQRYLIKILFKLYNQVFQHGLNYQERIILKSIRSPINRIPRIEARKEDISVGILSRNRPEQIERCLLSLVNQTVLVKEIVVIDGSNNNLTKKVVEAFSKYLPIKYIYEKRRGISWARNKVFRIAKGEIIACIDDDCEAFPDWIEEMLKAHKEHPDAVAIQGRCKILPSAGAISRVMQEDYNLWINRNLKDNNEMMILDLENSSFKRKKIVNLGVLYDDSFKKYYYCEDIDLGFQILTKDKKIIFWPRARVASGRRTSVFSLLKQRFLKGLSRANLDFKWSCKNNLEGLSLAGKIITYEKNSSRIKQMMASSFINNLNYPNPSLEELPKIGIIGRLAKPAFFFLFHNIYKFAYHYQRMVINSNYRRLDKSPKYSNSLATAKLSLSVMVITKDRSFQLRKCLDSLVSQTELPDEVIIVDSSKIPIESLINEYKKKLNIHYIYQKRMGFGVARNTAIEYATTDLMTTLDDAAVASKDWCRKIKNMHGGYPDVIAIQGRIYSLPKDSLIGIVEQLHIEKWFLGNLEIDNNFTTISTKNISFKLERFKRLKLRFKENLLYGLYGSEDLDIAYQIMALKEKIKYVPEIAIYHHERSSVSEYFKQQYRKGYSNGLIASTWKEAAKKKSSYFPFPKILEPIYRILSQPIFSTRNLLPLIAIYYLSDFFYYKGKYKAESDLKRLEGYKLRSSLIKKNSKLTVALIVKNKHDLEVTLKSLVHQTISPGKIIIVDVGNNNKLYEEVIFYESIFPIKYIESNKKSIASIKNDLIYSNGAGLIAFLDGGSEILKGWTEEVIKAHQKNPTIPVIQGRTLSMPKGGIVSTIFQFNHQTLIRDTMSGDRNLYWSWIKRGSSKDYSVFLVNINNSSLKPALVRDLGIKLDSSYSIGEDAFFSQQIYKSRNKIIYYPKISANAWQKSLIELIRRGVTEGRSIAGLKSSLLPAHRRLSDIHYTRRFIAFIYFCIKNRYIFSLPILVIVYLLYQASFLYGWKISSIQFPQNLLYRPNRLQ